MTPMSSQFRYVTEPEPQAVNLSLFRDDVGMPMADVSGPLIDARDGIDRCVVSPQVALMAAIRIANCRDAEVVVLGDLRLGDPENQRRGQSHVAQLQANR